MQQGISVGLLCRALFGTVALPIVAYATPTISSVETLTPTVNVARPAASPRVKLATSGAGTIVQFLWQGPSVEFVGQNFTDPDGFAGAVTVQGYLPPQIDGAGYQTEFSPYTEAGTWTLATLDICDANNNCSYYSASQFPPQTFKIVNAGEQDVQGPLFLKGTIKTPKVSLSRNPSVRILIDATDNVSGVGFISVCITPPAVGMTQLCAEIPPPLQPLRGGRFLATLTLPVSTAAGVYMVQNVYLRDIAGNSSNFNNPGQIYGEFGGATTITVEK